MTKKRITVLIPCLNEEKVIGDVIKAAWAGLNNDRHHQVLIMDSSTDQSPKIARKLGADVVTTKQRGLGQAYREATSHIKGDYIIMGDADGTYDYRELGLFVEQLDKGYEFVMGSRFKGWIEPSAMPKLHRYFGTPLTNWILNCIYSSHFSDIHCGMRGITTDAYKRLNLQSRSWEYASEMIIKSIHLKLKTTEVPIHFYKDKKGRISHVKRQGWLTPWLAGWISLRIMLVYGLDFLLYRPGILLTLLGLIIVLPLTAGPIGHFSLYTMLLGMSVTIIGLFSLMLGIIARILYDYSGMETQRWLNLFSYNRSSILSALLFIIGVGLTIPLLSDYFINHFQLPYGVRDQYYASVTGLLLIVSAFINFNFTLLLQAIAVRLQPYN